MVKSGTDHLERALAIVRAVRLAPCGSSGVMKVSLAPLSPVLLPEPRIELTPVCLVPTLLWKF